MKKSIKKSVLVIGFAAAAVIAAVSIFYCVYSGIGAPVSIIIVIQNVIGAFVCQTFIDIRHDIYPIAVENNNFFLYIISVLYGLALVAAVMCTVAAVLEVIRRYLLRTPAVFSEKRRKAVVIFGLNDYIESAVRKFSDEKYSIHIITKNDLPDDFLAFLAGRSVIEHKCPTHDAVVKQLVCIGTERIHTLMIFADDYFSHINIMRLFGKRSEGKIELSSEAKIYFFCKDRIDEKLAGDYFDTIKSENVFDLEIVNLSEFRAAEMYRRYPLYSCYSDGSTPVSDWNVRLLIAGFDEFGQQALLQAVNFGVFSKDNDIIIDVIDKNISERVPDFSSLLSSSAFFFDNNRIVLNNKFADGKIEITFYEGSLSCSEFRRLITEKPYTYIVLSGDNDKRVISSAMYAQKYHLDVPIITALGEAESADNLKGIADTKNIKILDGTNTILSINDLIGRKFDQNAKLINYTYSQFTFSNDGKSAVTKTDQNTAEKAWQGLSSVDRSSSRMLAEHMDIKEVIYRHICTQYRLNPNEFLNNTIGENGLAIQINGNICVCDDSKLCEMLRFEEAMEVKALYDILAGEHRRWCCYFLFRGWRYGEKKDKACLVHDCLINQELLMKKRPDTVKYDLLPLVMINRHSYR